VYLRRLTLGAVAGVLLGISVADAQPNPVLSTLGIDVWPEYDRPGVLVIYRATIAPDVPQPTRIVLRIPASAGLPNAVAEKLADGRLMTLPYERAIDGETARISLTASQPTVQLEYYDPNITETGARRRFVFTWPGDLDVRAFSISVQQPRGARNFVTVPDASRVAASSDGMTYHALSRVGVKTGETVEVQVSYEKASDRLSAEPLIPAAVLPATPASGSAASSSSRTVAIVLAALFLCAAAVSARLIITARPQARAGASSKAPPAARSGPAGQPRFCTQCGAGVDSDDRFCPRCGEALKAVRGLPRSQ
jgi:hypothetical protein